MAIEKMKRRNFLKKLSVVYGIAVACPGKLLKGKPVITGIDCNKPVKWMPFPTHDHPVFVKARQQGCTNSILYGIPYYFRNTPIYYQEKLPT